MMLPTATPIAIPCSLHVRAIACPPVPDASHPALRYNLGRLTIGSTDFSTTVYK